MYELLIAILIILISFGMFYIITLILKADKKVLALNDKIIELKNIDLRNFKKVISIAKAINKNIHLGKIKRIFEIVMTSISVFNIVVLIKKISDRQKA